MSNRPWDERQQVFRDLLRQVRREASLTQAELAVSLHKPQSYVSKYESGERKLDYLEVRSILECCDISIVDFDSRLLEGFS